MLHSLRRHVDIRRTQRGGPKLAARIEQGRSQYKLSVRLHWVSALNSVIDVDESGSRHPKKNKRTCFADVAYSRRHFRPSRGCFFFFSFFNLSEEPRRDVRGRNPFKCQLHCSFLLTYIFPNRGDRLSKEQGNCECKKKYS